MAQVISCKVRKAMRAARGRIGGTWRGKKLPSRRVLRNIVARAIIAEILAEERGSGVNT